MPRIAFAPLLYPTHPYMSVSAWVNVCEYIVGGACCAVGQFASAWRRKW